MSKEEIIELLDSFDFLENTISIVESDGTPGFDKRWPLHSPWIHRWVIGPYYCQLDVSRRLEYNVVWFWWQISWVSNKSGPMTPILKICPVSFEQVLEWAPEEVRQGLLFHLNVLS